MHVLLGRDQKGRYKFDVLQNLLTRDNDPQNPVRVQERCYIDVNRNTEEL